jgi:hypothetical protein
MAPIGSVLKNMIVYVIVVGVGSFVGVFFYIFNGLVATIQYANDPDGPDAQTLINDGANGLLFGTIIILISLGLGLALSIPNIVGDEMVEF